MKKKILLFGVIVILTVNSYSQNIEIDLYESLKLDNFGQIFNKENQSVPLDTLKYFANQSFSPDKSLYLKSLHKEKKYHLMTSEDSLIIELPFTSHYDKIVWLKNCLIIVGDDPMTPILSTIYLINFKNNKLSTFKVKGINGYIGQSESSCFFYAFKDSLVVGDYIIPHEKTIFSINENGLFVTNMKEREEDNKIIRPYYSDSFSLVMIKNNTGKYTYNFHYFDSIWSYDEPLAYFDKNDVYYCNGAYYVKINSKAIYRFDKNNVTKVVNCETMSIEQFMIENNHLIYSIYFDYQKPPLGILNLETMQTYHPIIINYND